MIYIAAVLILLILLLRYWSPKRYSVHASKAIRLPKGIRPEGRYVSDGFLHDEHGKPLDVSNKFVGQAVRESMDAYGIPDGATFIANYMTTKQKRNLKHGDIVVVDGEAAHSETGLRLRCVKSTKVNTIEFLPDGLGRKPRQRPLNEVIAKVTYVVNTEDHPSDGTFLNFIRGIAGSEKQAA
jgi:hypothetical protein